MSGTVVQVLARLKADAGDFVRGTRRANEATRAMRRQAIEASEALRRMAREMDRTGDSAVITAAELAMLAAALEGVNGEATKSKMAFAGAGTQMLKFGLIGGAVLAAGPPLLSFLQQLSGLIALLPALAGAAVIGIGTLAVGMSGFTKALSVSADAEKFNEALKNMAPAARQAARALAAMAPELRGFRNLIQQQLFTGMADNFRAIGERLLPGIAGGFQRVARAIRGVIGDLTKFWTSSRGISIWNSMLTGTAALIQRMRGGFVALSSALGTMAAVGSRVLGSIGGGFTSAMQRFDRFIQRVAANGSLEQFIRDGIAGFKTLMGVIHSLGMIVGGVVSAIRTAQGGLSSGFSDALRKFAVFLNSAKGQQAMVRLFQEVHRAVIGVGHALQTLGSFASALAPLVVMLARVAEWLLANKTRAKAFAIALALMINLGPAKEFIVILAIVAAGLRSNKKWVQVLTVAFAALWIAATGGIAGVVMALAGIVLLLRHLYTHSTKWRDIMDKVAVALMKVGVIGLKVVGALLRIWGDYIKFMVNNVYAPIVHGAAEAFGWIPGLGGKVKAASAAFDAMSQGIISGINAAAAAADTLAASLDNAVHDREMTIYIRQQRESLERRAESDNPNVARHAEEALARQDAAAAAKKKKKPKAPGAPKIAPVKIPKVGGYGFGSSGDGGGKTKALPPMLAQIPKMNSAPAMAALGKQIGAAMQAAGKAITLHFQTPMQKATASLNAAKKAATGALGTFRKDVTLAAQADRKAAAARAAYLAAHAKTVAALKASGGKVTDHVKALERAEQVAKRAAQAAASTAGKAAAQAKAAGQKALEAAKAVQEAQQALAQAKYDARVKTMQKAFAKIQQTVEKIKAKYDALVDSFAEGVKSLVDFKGIWDAVGQATESNGLGALKDANALAAELGVSMNKIIDQAGNTAAAVGQAALTPVQQTQKMLDDALAQSQTFLGDLTKLQAAGASQALLQQITDMGPKAGAALAEGLLGEGPDAIKKMGDTLDQLGKVSDGGIKGLAQKVFGPELSATEKALKALADQFKDVFGEIADDVAALTDEILGMTGKGKKGKRGKPGHHGRHKPGTGPSAGLMQRISGGGYRTFATSGGGTAIKIGDVTVQVPATAGGVTPADIAAAVQKGIEDALKALQQEMAAQ